MIASVTRPFCNNCDRVRLTADGQVRSCLFGRDDADLRTALRSGKSDDEIEALWRGRCHAKLRDMASTVRTSPARPPNVRDRRLVMPTVTVRFFAGAAAAAGCKELALDADTVADVATQLHLNSDLTSRECLMPRRCLSTRRSPAAISQRFG